MRTPYHPLGRQQAMTLLELLVVISIIAIVSVQVAPAVFSAKRNMALTLSVGHVIDSLTTARQTAITKNRPVEVRIYLGTENSSPYDRLLLVQKQDNEQGYEPIASALKLDEAIAMSPNTTWSSILTSGTTGKDSKGQYYAFRFMADGSSDLSIGSEPPTFTFIYRNDLGKGDLPPNFFTLQLDLQTGTVRPFRPL